jgi:hypothetical protein
MIIDITDELGLDVANRKKCAIFCTLSKSIVPVKLY